MIISSKTYYSRKDTYERIREVMDVEIMMGSEVWTVRSFVTNLATGECYSFDELPDEEKKKLAEIFNEKALNSLGYKKIID